MARACPSSIGLVLCCLLALVPAGPARAFIDGIDIYPPHPVLGDTVIVRVRGEFPSNGWTFLGHTTEVSGDAIDIVIGGKDEGGILPVTVPYVSYATVGILAAGSHLLTVTDPQDARQTVIDVADPWSAVPGDLNGDGAGDLSDAVFLFLALYTGGTQPACPNLEDLNGDGRTDLADVVYLLTYLFRGGSPPAIQSAVCRLSGECAGMAWLVDCIGHWECRCGACRPACDFTGCGDGFCDRVGGETYESCATDCKSGGDCRPVCMAIGTRSEGWYDSCTGKLITYAFCKDCEAECRACGSKSHGWWDTCTDQIIFWTTSCTCSK
jgi:hypothetical protein